jgi:2-polyprenyl-3-methyl-5-hydroxy-6-metoxy-1,4-benzoquinol methylase
VLIHQPRRCVQNAVQQPGDPAMADCLMALAQSRSLPADCEPRRGTITDLSPDDSFDTILYVDVLEHIEDHREELARAACHLAPNGSS